jgi:hypothetical protein
MALLGEGGTYHLKSICQGADKITTGQTSISHGIIEVKN